MKDIITIEQEELLVNRCDEIDIRKKNALMREVNHELIDTLKAHPDMLALSAPQIGYNARIFAVRFDTNIKLFINPILTQVKGLSLSRETSPSIPNKEFIRIRHNDITIMYQNPVGKIDTRRIVGKAATIIQQMIDNLDGLLLSDVGLEVLEGFDEAPEEERQQIINMYLESLELTSKEIHKDIDNDEDIKKINDASKFIQSVQSGETVLDDELAVATKPVEETVEEEKPAPKKRGRKKKVEADE